MAASIKITNNSVSQKSEPMFKMERSIYSIKTRTNSCKIKQDQLPMQTKNLYQVLSLQSRNVSFEELKKAYRAKVLQLHPDVCPSSIRDECMTKFIELQKAYEVLLNPNSRRMYDNELILVESFGGGCYCHEEEGGFSRRVWEKQLDGLEKRSVERMESRKMKFM